MLGEITTKTTAPFAPGDQKKKKSERNQDVASEKKIPLGGITIEGFIRESDGNSISNTAFPIYVHNKKITPALWPFALTNRPRNIMVMVVAFCPGYIQRILNLWLHITYLQRIDSCNNASLLLCHFPDRYHCGLNHPWIFTPQQP